MGKKIRESVALWKTYARGAPLLVNGQDILSILDREDDLISKNVSPACLVESRQEEDKRSHARTLATCASITHLL